MPSQGLFGQDIRRVIRHLFYTGIVVKFSGIWYCDSLNKATGNQNWVRCLLSKQWQACHKYMKFFERRGQCFVTDPLHYISSEMSEVSVWFASANQQRFSLKEVNRSCQTIGPFRVSQYSSIELFCLRLTHMKRKVLLLF